MKKFKNIVLLILGILLFLNILIIVLLNIPAIQSFVVDLVVSKVKEKTDNEISIGRVDIDLFNGVFLNQIYVADQKGDTLLYAERLSADASAFTVYRQNKLHISRVSLENFKAYVSKDSLSGPFNFQFMMDAFAAKDTAKKDTTPSKFDLSIGEIRLVNGRFRYDIKSAEETPSIFNASHIHVDSLNTNISVNSIKPESFKVDIDNISLNEESGIHLRHLGLKAYAKGKIIHAEDLELDLPKTHLALTDILFDYEKIEADSTQPMKKAVCQVTIKPSKIYPYELAPFLPALAPLKTELGISAKVSGNLPGVAVKNLNAYYGDDVVLSLSAEMGNIYRYGECDYLVDMTHLFATVDGVSNIIKAFAPQTELPEIVNRLGYVEASLGAKGKLKDLLIDLKAKSNPGSVNLTGNLGYDVEKGDFRTKADLKTKEFGLGSLLDSTLQLGKVSISAIAEADIPRNGKPTFTLDGLIPLFEYKGYAYHNIDLDASYCDHDAKADMSLADSNLVFKLKGIAKNIGADSMHCNLTASVDGFSPYRLHLSSEEMAGFLLKTRVKLDMDGNSPENITCHLMVDSTCMDLDTIHLDIDHLTLAVEEAADGENKIDLTSPFFDAHIKGTYNVETIAQSFNNALNPFLPTFFPIQPVKKGGKENDLDFNVNIKNTEMLSKVLKLPLVINQSSHIAGYFRPKDKGLSVDADIPSFQYGSMDFRKTKLAFHNEDTLYLCSVQTQIGAGENRSPIHMSVRLEAEKDVILARLNYDNAPDKFKLKGSISTLVSFKKEEAGNLLTKLTFRPSELTVNDLTTNFLPAVVEIRPDDIKISNFALAMNNTPLLMIDGHVNNVETDSLIVLFKNASVKNLLGAVNKIDLPVDGYLNGSFHLSSLMGKPKIFTKAFHIDNISYNTDSIGSLVLDSRWSNKWKGMHVGAMLFRGKENVSSADGYLSPANDRIHFEISLNMLQLQLAEMALKGSVHNLSGYCGADLKVDGKLSAPDILGYIYVKDAKATIDFTDVTYRMSDTISFTPTKVEIKDMTVMDSKNHKMTINCTVKHKEFKDFKYTTSIKMNDFMLLNNPSKTDSLLYGTFIATGNLYAKGDMKGAEIDGNLRNGDNTDVMIRLPESVTKAQTYNNIVYVSTETVTKKEEQAINNKLDKKDIFKIKVDVAIELTQTSTFGAIINPSTGDAVSFNGDGNINAQFDSETSTTKLFGQYVINNGSLRMKLSQLPVKTFSILSGSKILFNGDPMSSSFDIQAGYRVRADLTNLDASFSSMGLSSTRVPVECDLGIQGNLRKFDITYNISLPESNDDLQRTVNSIITTDDIKIKEFAYLIGFGMFYPPNNSQTTDNNSSIVSTIASSSLSGALNSALSGVLGNKVTIGTDLSSSQENFSDMEMNVSVSTQLFNDRLIVNTNLGYKNKGTATADENQNSSSLFGDFDMEYKLTKSGMFRLKAYNRANNEVYSTSSTTQGLGIVFVKESKKFNGLFDLRPTRSTLMEIPHKNNNDEDSTAVDSMKAYQDTLRKNKKETLKKEVPAK
ncbi:MAG TPA: translocation/assembly module TamB domain-containing protein [Paludibacteraceae bacterium]|nr:translocation/assembly module TamB domain-containing protein [Paludibacteraceae bacterium]